MYNQDTTHAKLKSCFIQNEKMWASLKVKKNPAIQLSESPMLSSCYSQYPNSNLFIMYLTR